MVEKLLAFQTVAEVVRRHHVVVQVDTIEGLVEDFRVIVALHYRFFLIYLRLVDLGLAGALLISAAP